MGRFGKRSLPNYLSHFLYLRETQTVYYRRRGHDQEEVAQKIAATQGRGYNPTSLLLQHHFDVSLMEKIEPAAFEPAPKVHSRLLYFKPKAIVKPIPQEEDFWKFAKLCFSSPRRTLANNLKQAHYPLTQLESGTLQLRAQQLSFDMLLDIWQRLQS